MSEMEEEQQGVSPDHNDKTPNRSPSKVSSKRKGDRSEVTGWANVVEVV